jgi:hypothetical protein
MHFHMRRRYSFAFGRCELPTTMLHGPKMFVCIALVLRLAAAYGEDTEMFKGDGFRTHASNYHSYDYKLAQPVHGRAQGRNLFTVLTLTNH